MSKKFMKDLVELTEFGLSSNGLNIFVIDQEKLVNSIEKLVKIAVLDVSERKVSAQFIIQCCAQQLGIFPSSIHDLYIARGNGEVASSFTTPAINLRALSFDSARIAFRSAQKINSGLLIFEIARVELFWSGITLSEYAACILGAAIAERYTGPVFLQGDHFQVDATQPLEEELLALKDLIRRAIRAGFYNIDIDTSTLVDLSQETIDKQQAANAQVSAELAAYTRNHQPEGVTITIGGEIGEVGGHVTTSEELHSYLVQFNNLFSRRCPGQAGLSKVSIHTGTTHGGNMTVDGSIKTPTIDFSAIQKISWIGQKEYGLGGVVQHGASTLPYHDLQLLVNAGTLEVHLATALMKSMFDHLPVNLVQQIHEWLYENYSSQRLQGMTDAQFFHKVEMHALAAFKEQFWNLSEDEKMPILAAWENQFDQMFANLGCENSRDLIDKYIHPARVAPIFDLSEVAPGALELRNLSG